MAKDTVSLDFIEKNKKGEYCDLEMVLLHEIMSYSVALIFFHVSLRFQVASHGNIVQQRRGQKGQTDRH